MSKEKLKITVLGCGGSAGVPAAGNYWGTCDPNEPKNRRNRCSLAVQSNTANLIIDTGPDFRYQINQADIRDITAVLYTHYHGDHVDGIGDLRGFRFRSKQLVPIYLDQDTLDVFNSNLPHLMGDSGHDVYPQILDPNVITDECYGKPKNIHDVKFVPFLQDHDTCNTVGYRFGDFAYSVDVIRLEKPALETLKGVKTWMVDSTGYHQTDNKVHINLQQIYAYNEIIQAERVILTSLSLGMDYQTLISELPDGYEPAYDGMVFEANYD